jgi:putative DNA primase/helicase
MARPKVAKITDIGETYCNRHRDQLIFSRSGWYVWNGKIWELCHDQVQSKTFWDILVEYKEIDGQTPSLSKKRSLADYVKAQLFVPDGQLDAFTGLVNLQNGIFNLEDGNLYPHNPDYYMTTILPFEYDASAKAPFWEHYVETTFTKPRDKTYDPELVEFVQEAMGYSLTTDVSHHVTFWAYGEGANGKGVLFHVLEQLAGDTATPLNVGMLHREQYQLAMLAGKNVALCSEASASDNLVEDALIKALVAGDTMMVRQIRREPFELQPTVKLWWSMNKLPAVSDTSKGFWRRVRIIPFNRTFEGAEKIIDLKEKLDQELSGIFNWAMAGLRRLRNQGDFTLPRQVEIATARYQKESNPVQLFVEDECRIDDDLQVQSSDIYRAYSNWCDDNGFRRQSIKNFKIEMERLGYYSKRLSSGSFFEGLELKNQSFSGW